MRYAISCVTSRATGAPRRRLFSVRPWANDGPASSSNSGFLSPHPEEPYVAWRLEGRGRALHPRPSFETRAAHAPQDEVEFQLLSTRTEKFTAAYAGMSGTYSIVAVIGP